MPNYDGRYEVRIFYTTTPTGEALMQHVLTIDANVTNGPLSPPTDFANIDVSSGIQSDSLEVAVDNLVDALIAFYPSTTSFIRAELWQYDPEPSQNALYIGTMLLGDVGVASGNSVAAGQNTLTLRTVGGGIMRVQLMETTLMNNVKDPYPFGSTAVSTLADLLLGVNGFFLGRDNTKPVVPIYFSQTQNERLYKKRYRE